MSAASTTALAFAAAAVAAAAAMYSYSFVDGQWCRELWQGFGPDVRRPSSAPLTAHAHAHANAHAQVMS